MGQRGGNRRAPEREEALNRAALRALPAYTGGLRHGDPGMGCSGDPPGFITYYMFPLYDSTGNTPDKAPDSVIRIDGGVHVVNHQADYQAVARRENGDRWDAVQDLRHRRHLSLYKPLPVEHARVQAWMMASFAHHARHYLHPTSPDEYGHGRLSLFYPISHFLKPKGWKHGRGKHLSFTDDPTRNDRWREAQRALIVAENNVIDAANAEADAWNAPLIEEYDRLCVTANHAAVVYIREYYPDLPDSYFEKWIATPPRNPGSWWETMAERPTPETCPGDLGKKHPFAESWCQFCGWYADEPAGVGAAS